MTRLLIPALQKRGCFIRLHEAAGEIAVRAMNRLKKCQPLNLGKIPDCILVGGRYWPGARPAQAACRSVGSDAAWGSATVSHPPYEAGPELACSSSIE